jgi:hypothetical protein
VTPDVDVAGFAAMPPESIVANLRTEAENTLASIAQALTLEKRTPGLDAFAQRIRDHSLARRVTGPKRPDSRSNESGL